MRVDQPDDGDTAPSRPDPPRPHAADAGSGRAGGAEGAQAARPAAAPDSGNAATRTERTLEHRAQVDAAYRAHAIDQGCARVERIERETVTPALRRIEAEDPGRHLAGLEHRLKGRDRLSEKVNEAVTERARTIDEALATVKDAIRYTFRYPDGSYTAGVNADCARLSDSGFERVERRNSWSQEEYKGINSRWREPVSGQIFEVQFHTQASFEAKQETHWAYERLRDPATSKADQEALSAYQCKVSARIPIPPGAQDIPDYRHP